MLYKLYISYYFVYKCGLKMLMYLIATTVLEDDLRYSMNIICGT